MKKARSPGATTGCRRDEPGQVRARVAGPLHQRVPGVAEGGDGGHHDLAVVVLEQVRRLQAARAVRDRVVVGLLGRADLEGQVGDPVAVRGDPLAQPGPGPGRAAEDEPRAARLQDVHRLVRVPGLRAAVRGPPHAERGRVVVRRLLRVPDREDHGVHADDGKTVLRWRGHAARMRTRFPNCASTKVLTSHYVYLIPNG